MLIPCKVTGRNHSVTGGCGYWGNPVSAMENTGGSYCKRKKPSHRVPTKQPLASHGCNTERTIKPVDLCLKACWWKNSSPLYTDRNAQTQLLRDTERREKNLLAIDAREKTIAFSTCPLAADFSVRLLLEGLPATRGCEALPT